MKRVNLANILYLFIFLILISCSKEEDAIDYSNSKVEKIITNVSYGDDSQQTFDIYLPANRSSKTTKTLILIHGGAWISGDKSDMNTIVNTIKKELPNYAIVNMNYRLASIDNPAFPMQLNDIKYVVNTIKENKYDVSDKIGLIGASAGAHLAMLYSYALNDEDIKIVVSLIGPTNLIDENYLEDNKFKTLFEIATGVPYKDNENYYKQLSPLHHVSNITPPTIMFYGNQDPLVPNTQSIDLNQKLRSNLVYRELYTYNSGHGDWSQSDQADINKKLIKFIKKKF